VVSRSAGPGPAALLGRRRLDRADLRLTGAARAGAVAAAAGGLANLVNNLPATLIALPLAHGDAHAAYALLVGTDIGPNLTSTGSLATLLWLTLARERDAGVSPRLYLAVGALTAPAGMAAALGVLWLLR
jgi:arsenical pump membrane protein